MSDKDNVVKIDKEIKGFKIVDKEKEKEEKIKKAAESIVMMSEKVKRPEKLVGATYKIKNPAEEHALYVTINDIVLNEGTDHQSRRPFEIFINSKNMENFQWVVALTRVMSAVFRKGGDMEFLVEELRSVFDPNGGFFYKGTFVPSLVAQIGAKVEEHLVEIGVIKVEEMPEHQRAIIEEKKQQYLASLEAKEPAQAKSDENVEVIPNAQICKKCSNQTVIIMDGCLTCLTCGDSKCG